MNYLAHFYLSNNDSDLLCGNFIADNVKGKAFENYSANVQKGIQLHREIDSFTDSHPIVQQSKQRLFPKYRHYSAVIIDMYYDHFLAVNWSDFSSIPLNDFAENCYCILLKREDMPTSSEFMLKYMHEQDWLSSYANMQGLGKALSGLSNRTSFESKMEKSIYDLEENYGSFQQEFSSFFPELINNCHHWMLRNLP